MDDRDRLSRELPERHTWAGRPNDAVLGALPGCAAVFLLLDAGGAPVWLATTQQLKRLTRSRLNDLSGVQRARADLGEIARGILWRRVSCPFEGRWRYYRLARLLYPNQYRKLISFKPAWFLRVNWQQDIPLIKPSDRVWNALGEFVGPWPTQKSYRTTLELLWDLFDLCRYPEQVRRAPSGLRCAYAEMGRCDAPCDGSAPLDPYRSRCRDAWAFLHGDIDDWMLRTEAGMQCAAQELRFEQAAQLKQQLAAARDWRKEWGACVRDASAMRMLLLLPVTRRKAWTPFLFDRGYLIDGPVLPERKVSAEAAAWLASVDLENIDQLDPIVRMEQTWLVCHFLNHRESKRAILISGFEQQSVDDLTRRIESEVASRRRSGGRSSR